MPRRNRKPLQARTNRASWRSQEYVPLDPTKLVIPQGRCGRKMIFPTEQEAQAALKRTRIERIETGNLVRGQEVRAYNCDRCQGWHLTKLPIWQKERTK